MRHHRLFCGLLAACLVGALLAAPTVPATTKDDLTAAVTAAQQAYQEAQERSQQLQQQLEQTQAQIGQLQGQSEQIREQLNIVYAQMVAAQDALAAAEAEVAATADALAQTQAEYDETFARSKSQLEAMQRLDDGGGIAMLSQARDLYQLLSFAQVLEDLSKSNQDTLTDLASRAALLDQQRQLAEEAAARAQQAKDALDAQMAALQATADQLSAALQQANADLSAQQADAQAQAALTEEALKAYEKANAELDAYVKAQSSHYTTPSMHCSLDFRNPLDSYSAITTRFGAPDAWSGAPHRGTDFAAPKGTPIYAAADGVVSVATFHPSWGNYVLISHGKADDGRVYDTLYAHMSSYVVSPGTQVAKGQLIGYVGNTGNVVGANGGYHLHLEMRINYTLTDPLPWLG